MANIYKKATPALFERVMSDIQDGLSANFAWLTNCFGKAERVQRIVNNNRYYEPTWYIGKDDYITLTPSQNLGNYSFFVLSEPQETYFEVWGSTRVKAPFSLIIWFDMRKIDSNARNIEGVKENLLKCLNGVIRPANGHYKVAKIYERAENVWQGFTLDETDNQFMMSPFCALRFSGEMEVATTCTPNVNDAGNEPEDNNQNSNDNE